MKTASIIIFTLACIRISAQPPNIIWNNAFGAESSYSSPNAMRQTQTGEYLIAGQYGFMVQSGTSSSVEQNGFIANADSFGNILWQYVLGGSQGDYFMDIAVTSDDGFIVTGTTGSSDGDVPNIDSNSQKAWVIKFDSEGIIQWNKVFGTPQIDYGNSIIQTLDGGFLLGGSTGGSVINPGSLNYWIVKLNPNGDIEWQKYFGGSGQDVLTDVKQTKDGGYILSGISNSLNGDVSSNNGLFDAWIVKLDIQGNITWEQNFGGDSYDYLISIHQTADDGYIASGYTESQTGSFSQNHGGRDLWVVKMDPDGIMTWQKFYGGTSHEMSREIIETVSGNYVVVGDTSTQNNGDVAGLHYIPGNFASTDIWILELNGLGDIIWQKTIGGYNPEDGTHIIQGNDGTYVLCGNTLSDDGDVSPSNSASQSSWIIKLENQLGTSNHNIKSMLTFPNPAENVLNINYPVGITVNSSAIVDINGRTIVQYGGGPDQINIEPLSDGIYFLKITTQQSSYTSKFIKN